MLRNVRSFFMIMLSLSLVVPLYSFSGGDGSSGNPFQVSNCNELQNISQVVNLGFDYILTSDIDCSSNPNFQPIEESTLKLFPIALDGLFEVLTHKEFRRVLVPKCFPIIEQVEKE